MKVFLGTDLEGVSGVVSFEEQTYPTGKYYEAAKRLLTAEINAAVDGLLAEGVDDVLVWDGHGSGGIVFEELHPAAKLMHGRPMPPWSTVRNVIRRYDVCMIIGQHAMAGVADGNLNHTQISRVVDGYKLNGRPIGELAQFALFCGALGLPMIYLTGDCAACREAEELVPGIVTTAVKEGLARNYAISLPAVEARRLVRAGAARAAQQQKKTPLPPLIWPGPFVLEKRYFHTDAADGQMRIPGAERIDSQTVRFRGDDILDVLYR